MSDIELAFWRDPELLVEIDNAVEENPNLTSLFEKVARFYLDYRATVRSIPATNGVGEPPAKKRKISPEPSATVPDQTSRSKVLELHDISFTIPQRKKLTLTISLAKPSNDQILTVSQPNGGAVVCEISRSQIAHAFKLPVPEKTLKQWNYIMLPKDKSKEPLLWTVTAGTLNKVGDTTGGAQPRTHLQPEQDDNNSLDTLLASHGSNNSNISSSSSSSSSSPHLSLTTPTSDQFVSTLRESHRKTDPCYHVKAFRGSKDGFLFFLSSGILFGFKKPVLFLSLADIVSISYTSVLQRTFNLDVVYKMDGGAEDGGRGGGGEGEGEGGEEEVEFSMLDQAEFGGIDGYVKRHGLNDASLAEGRRAKLLGGNRKVHANANGNTVEGEGEQEDGRTELEKVEQQLQDEEDEMEEDFELDSEEAEGSSGGSGDDDDGSDGGDLVEEELGSEAEDVEDEGSADDEAEEQKLDDPKVLKHEQMVLTQIPGRDNEPSAYDDDQL